MTLPTDPRNDQAEGLRQMFAHTRVRFIPVVSNPHIAFGGVLLERLCTAFAEHRATTLVVDAAERAGEAGEMALVDLSQCIERLSDRVSYLTARGLPIRFVDASGSTRAFLQRLVEAAPACDVVLLHASAPELCRLFSQKRDGSAWSEAPCPIVLAEDHPDSVTHAYAATKLLAQRAGLVVFDLLLGAATQSPRAERIAAKFASCMDMYFGGVLRESVRIDPAGDAAEPPGADLRRLVAGRLRGARRDAASSSSTTTAILRSTVAFS
jgi:hypothetical protein